MNEKLIEDIIAMLDRSMEKGTGHVNIVVNNADEIQFDETEVEKTVVSQGCTDCAK